LHGQQGVPAALALLELLVVALHETSGGSIVHLPEGHQGVEGAGHVEGPLKPVEAFTALLAPGGGVAGGEHHQLGATELQLSGFLGGEGGGRHPRWQGEARRGEGASRILSSLRKRGVAVSRNQ
jgi:hypothetical protein